MFSTLAQYYVYMQICHDKSWSVNLSIVTYLK